MSRDTSSIIEGSAFPLREPRVQHITTQGVLSFMLIHCKSFKFTLRRNWIFNVYEVGPKIHRRVPSKVFFLCSRFIFSCSALGPWIWPKKLGRCCPELCGIPLPFGIRLDCEELKGLTNPVAPTPEYFCYFFLVNNHFIAKGQLVYEGKQYWLRFSRWKAVKGRKKEKFQKVSF